MGKFLKIVISMQFAILRIYPVSILLQVLSHLINQLGHFPFSCGAAQMSSVVSEYHDCPSLRYLNELSTEIFYLPRVQVSQSFICLSTLQGSNSRKHR